MTKSVLIKITGFLDFVHCLVGTFAFSPVDENIQFLKCCVLLKILDDRQVYKFSSCDCNSQLSEPFRIGTYNFY